LRREDRRLARCIEEGVRVLEGEDDRGRLSVVRKGRRAQADQQALLRGIERQPSMLNVP
jgi:hypothetical protein